MTPAPPTPSAPNASDPARRRPTGAVASVVTRVLLSLPLGVLGAGGVWVVLNFFLVRWLVVQWYPQLGELFADNRTPGMFTGLIAACGICSVLTAAAFVMGLIRRGWALSLLRKGYLTVYAFGVVYAWVVLDLTGQVEEAGTKVGGQPIDPVTIFAWRCECLWPAACLGLLVGVLHVISWRRAVIGVYTGRRDPTPAAGDHIIENIRTHGHDPGFRKSVLSSIALHLLVIVILPLLMRLRGCVEPYRIPLGSGNPAVAIAQIVRPKEEKKRKKYILSADAPIVFEAPDLDDSKLMKEVDEATNLTYVANASAAQGAMGTGGGNTPGWADGFADGVVRFIRLEYRGSDDWDDGMDSTTRADMNFLEEFKKLSGGIKIARKPESHPISHLSKYPKGQAPPFVYMTGSNAIHVTKSDLNVLREYIQGGGMLFADAGSSRWDRSFRSFVRALLPGNPMLEISEDDPLFQFPFTFPHGPPPLWHHGGTKALGVKCGKHWGVFYYPGDLNDAWKTGHSGLDPRLAKGAFYLGTNVVYHSFTQYLQATRKYRK